MAFLLLHAGVVQKCFVLGEGWGWALIKILGFQGGRLLSFWAFRVGAFSRWALIQEWAVNRINTVAEMISYHAD